MYRIRRLGVVRTATVVAVAYAIVFAIIFLPIALLGAAFAPNGNAALVGILTLGVVLVVVYPLLIWIFTALACLVYNLAARWVGGIEVEIERVQPPGYPPSGYPYAASYGQASGQAPWATPAGQPPPYGGGPPQSYGAPPGSHQPPPPPDRR